MPVQAHAPNHPNAPQAERRFRFAMIRCPSGEPYLQLSMQTGMSARPAAKAFFTAPQVATVVAKDVTLAQALRMVGDATNRHFEERDGIQVLQPGAPAPLTGEKPRPFEPGPEADPILRRRGSHYYGFSRNTCLDVVVRLLNDNVVVDPAVMGSGDCNHGISFDVACFADLLVSCPRSSMHIS